jgi:phosphoserine phosphatase
MGSVIAIDLDEVLGQFLMQLSKFYNANACQFSFAIPTSLQPADFFSYRFSDVWGGTDEQSIEIVEAFFNSPCFLDGLPLVPGALEGVKALKDAGHELVIVTSRQLILEEVTRRWVDDNFPPGTFSRVVFGNHWGATGRKVSKPELCRELNAELIVDDAVVYCKQCADGGMRALLFGEYAWNRNDDEKEPLPASVTRVSCWKEVVSQILSK